jgi:hypothetical protein
MDSKVDLDIPTNPSGGQDSVSDQRPGPTRPTAR